MKDLRLALVQSRSTVGTETFDPRADNLDRAIESIGVAVSKGAQMVVFGEMYLSGYRTDEWLHKWATQVDTPDDHVQELISVAKANDIHILMGAGTFGHFMPGDVYNSTLVIGPGGLIGVYRKTHVAAFPHGDHVSKERSFYSPGRELPVFDTALGRIGVHICYDITFPEVARVQTLKGAELLINTSASAAGFEEFWDHALFTRAAENATWYAVCSVVGQQRGDTLFGGSRIVDPTGKVVAAGKYNEEDLVIADIDLSRARDVRASMHTFSTRQPGLYAPITDMPEYP